MRLNTNKGKAHFQKLEDRRKKRIANRFKTTTKTKDAKTNK